MTLSGAIWSQELDEANRLLDDSNYNVNELVRYPPLKVCASCATDSKDKRGYYMGDECVSIMRRILQHPTFIRDPVNDPCSGALWEICEE